MLSIARADVVQKATADLAAQLELRNKEVVTELETTAKSLGFGIRAVQGGVQTFPILHGKPVSAEQFAALDESTKRALGEAEGALTTEVERSAQLVKQASATFEAAREEAFGQAAAALIDTTMKALIDAFAPYGEAPKSSSYLGARGVRRSRRTGKISSQRRRASGRGGRATTSTRDVDPDARHAPEPLPREPLRRRTTPRPRPPVLYETNPTYPNLFGYPRVRRARFGALLTDFTRIRAGVLHRASGGVLVVARGGPASPTRSSGSA